MHFKQFEADILAAYRPTIIELTKGKEGEEFLSAFSDFLIDHKGMQAHRRAQSIIDKYKTILLSGFSEIAQSYYTLRDIEMLIEGLTTHRTKIAKARLLSYHIHNYLNENYILQTRLKRYPIKIARASKRPSKQVDRLIESVIQEVTATFSGIIDTRGRHVHEQRYHDDDLFRLSLLEQAAMQPSSDLTKLIHNLFRADFAICKRSWLTRIQRSNDAVEKLLDKYFATLHPIVFDDTGKIVMPREVKSA